MYCLNNRVYFIEVMFFLWLAVINVTEKNYSLMFVYCSIDLETAKENENEEEKVKESDDIVPTASPRGKALSYTKVWRNFA